MSRIFPVTPENTPEASRPALEKVNTSFGSVANIFTTLANSPGSLNSYLDFNQALTDGLLSPQLREQISLTVAKVNRCDYCASAHTALGKMAGLNEDDIKMALMAKANDPKADAVLDFAKKLTENQGHVTDEDIDILRQRGCCQGFIIEVVANVSLNIFTNYLNNVAQTEIDFPKVSTLTT